MSFFKKLFNKLTGKTDAPAVAVEEHLTLPAPEPDVVEIIPDRVVDHVRPAAATKAKASDKPEPKKLVVKKPEPKEAEVRKPAPKKSATKKALPKKPELKKAELKKPEPKPSKSAALKKEVSKTKVTPPQPAPKKKKLKSVPAPPPVVQEEYEEEFVAEVVTPAVAPPATTPEVVEPAPEMFADAPDQHVAEADDDVDVKLAPQESTGWFARLREGLSKSSKSITGQITSIFTKRKLDAETLQELEDTLISADLGLPVAERIIKAVSEGRYNKEIDPEEVKQILAKEVAKVLNPVDVPFFFGEERPFVVLVVGVNGSGKTTTIGKLGAIAQGEGYKVKFAACDTFRAAAIEQLTEWGRRIGAETISRPQGADAAGLAFDAMKASQEDNTDILFIDTAGRLHNKTYLMDELDKVVRVIKKYDESAPHAVLLVLDATTGQNALAQAEAFTKVAGVTGIIMTKLDGTARGGILVAIAEKFVLPIHAIGVGEKIEDLQPFDANAFARAIAGLD